MIALAVSAALGLQLEAGAVAMQPPSDDTYVERQMGSHESYNTLAFGASLLMSTGPFRLSVGWRNLGDQHSSGPIIADAQYFALVATHGKMPAAQQYWKSEGNEQQVFAELGYALRFDGGLRVIPSLGIAENRITWHSTVVWHATGAPYSADMHSIPQMHPAPFAGLTFERGAVGVGFYYLVTDPVRSMAVDSDYPGQGRSAIYARVTYTLGGGK